jgi:hypothetical protein
MSELLYKEDLQEKDRLEEHLVELRKPLQEALFGMKNAREVFERTVK